RNPAAPVLAPGSQGFAGCDAAVPKTPRTAGGIRRHGRSHRALRLPQRRSDQAGCGHPDGGALMSMFDNYTPPWMDEELHILRDAVRRFYEREFVPLVKKWDEQGCVDRDAWYKAGEAGILCASIPTEYGGGGGSFKHEMV